MTRVLLLFVVANILAFSDQGNVAVQAARIWRMTNERPIIDQFFQLLSMPNVASNLDAMKNNAEAIRKMMEQRRIRTELIQLDGAPPLIFGEVATPGATQTVVFYAHYDGQPVDPSQWTGSKPFEPVLRDGMLEAGGKIIPLPAEKFQPEWRIYARSASDDKAPIVAMMAALDGIRAANVPLRSNLKFVFDGEEEAGSPHLGSFIRGIQGRLAGDVWVFCDGPVHQTRKQQVVFGVRGSAGMQITLYGPKKELHSGHYGNWAPNPAMMLARLLASMRDDDGKVLIPGFYDDVEPLSDAEKQALAAVPNLEADLKKEMGLGRAEGAGRRLEELINLPALNIQGVASANVGAQSRNVIPANATASIGLRLVKGMDHRRTIDKVIDHIRKQGYHIVNSEPDDATRAQHAKICRITGRDGGYNAVRAPMDLPVSKKVVDAVKSARGEVILMPTLGGSLPIAPIAEIMKTPVVIVPIANHDNNQHAHNENLRIQNLWDGIETMAALMGMQ
ncbi:MAG: M20/M25/M40 family metallo-hydrolase [Acidobacteria bacterium]|nr:M20/M25/M40 family metallo-hydrolase [Acidobacteriota bacterium]